MKRFQFFLVLLTALATLLVISCASQSEISAEEERMLNGEMVADAETTGALEATEATASEPASTPQATESAPSNETVSVAPAPTTPRKERKVVKRSVSKVRAEPLENKLAQAAPQLPSTALLRDGKLLNRYYFLRPSDTAEKVAKQLYGSEERAKDLTLWNKGEWVPGEPIFYTSALQPADNQMLSYYEEAAIRPQSYTVKGGETLFSIAKDTYGDKRTWKEIAILNGLQNTEVDAGREIMLLPANLAAYSMTIQAKNSQMAPANGADPVAANAEAPKLPEPVLREPVSEAKADLEDMHPLEGKKTEAKLAEMSFGQFVSQHLFLLLTIGLFATIVLVVAVKRFRSSRDSVDF